MKGIFFFLFLLLFSPLHSQTISSIQFEGNRKSKERFLRQNISISEGEIFDSAKVEQSVQLLRNTNLFFDVTAIILSPETEYPKDLKAPVKEVQIIFTVKEVLTVFPILANGGSSERLNFTLGVSDIHFRGLGQTIGLVYQYYDRHSFKFYQITPRHKNNITGHEVFLGKYSTIEPLYFADSTVAPFNFDNYHISAAGYFWLNRFWVSKIGGMLMSETYKNREIDVNSGPYVIAPNQSFNLFKYQLRGQLEWRKIEHHYERRQGHSNLCHLEWIETPKYADATFLKFTNEYKAMVKFGERHNIILKNTIGIASNNDSPFSPFVIDDFVNVRGVGNRVARGTALCSFNSEYLLSLIKHPLFFAQLAGFADLSYLRPPGAKIETINDSENTYASAGLGIRIHSRKWYNTVFRFDYGINLKDTKQGGFVIGLGQFI